MTLVPDEKDRSDSAEIGEEEIRKEIVRLEARRRFEQDLPKRRRIWMRLNSGFPIALVIWFLSSGSIALINFYQNKHQENRQKRAKIRELDLEISIRLLNFADLLHSAIERKVNQDSLRDALWGLENPSRSKYADGVFPEFKERNLKSLIWELEQLVDKGELGDLHKAFAGSVRLSRIAASLTTDIPPDGLEGTAKEIDEVLRERFSASRWELERRAGKSPPLHD